MMASSPRWRRVVRIAITQAAFDAIISTMSLGSVGYENELNEKGERLIWVSQWVMDRLRLLRGPGESYSDVILRLAESVEFLQRFIVSLRTALG
jgi:hypothetical protein